MAAIPPKAPAVLRPLPESSGAHKPGGPGHLRDPAATQLFKPESKTSAPPVPAKTPAQESTAPQGLTLKTLSAMAGVLVARSDAALQASAAYAEPARATAAATDAGPTKQPGRPELPGSRLDISA